MDGRWKGQWLLFFGVANLVRDIEIDGYEMVQHETDWTRNKHTRAFLKCRKRQLRRFMGQIISRYIGIYIYILIARGTCIYIHRLPVYTVEICRELYVALFKASTAHVPFNSSTKNRSFLGIIHLNLAVATFARSVGHPKWW